jgi:hypothetical protein
MITLEPEEIRNAGNVAKTTIEDKRKGVIISKQEDEDEVIRKESGTAKRNSKTESLWKTFETNGLKLTRLHELKRMLENQYEVNNRERIEIINKAIKSYKNKIVVYEQLRYLKGM